MESKRYEYKGQRIVKDAFRFRVVSMARGDVSGMSDDYSVPSFKTLTAAKAFIDRNS